MIGELQSQKADLVVADITITYEREQGVDFTMPFMNLGVTILYKKPTKKDPNLFSFLSPLSFDVWIYIITAYLAVSLLLFIISRSAAHPAAPPPTAHLSCRFSPFERSVPRSELSYLSDQAGLRLARWDAELFPVLQSCCTNEYLEECVSSADLKRLSRSPHITAQSFSFNILISGTEMWCTALL